MSPSPGRTGAIASIGSSCPVMAGLSMKALAARLSLRSLRARGPTLTILAFPTICSVIAGLPSLTVGTRSAFLTRHSNFLLDRLARSPFFALIPKRTFRANFSSEARRARLAVASPVAFLSPGAPHAPRA